MGVTVNIYPWTITYAISDTSTRDARYEYATGHIDKDGVTIFVPRKEGIPYDYASEHFYPISRVVKVEKEKP